MAKTVVGCVQGFGVYALKNTATFLASNLPYQERVESLEMLAFSFHTRKTETVTINPTVSTVRFKVQYLYSYSNCVYKN
jgi:hypothetical protein